MSESRVGKRDVLAEATDRSAYALNMPAKAGRGHTYKNTDKGVGIGAKILTKLGEFKYKY